MRPAGDVRLALVQACERIHRDTGQEPLPASWQGRQELG